MTRIILESDNKRDILIIKELADRLNIKCKIQDLVSAGKSSKNILKYYKLIEKGVDVSNYGNPSLWQKTVRKDRNNITPA